MSDNGFHNRDSSKRQLRRFDSATTLVSFSLTLTYGAGLWLVVLHHLEGGHERGEPPLVLHWLRDATLAAPVVLLAVWLSMQLASRLLERRAAASWGQRLAVVATLSATLASLALAAGSPVHAWIFEAQEGHVLPVYLHLARDGLLAFFVAFPLAGALAVVALRDPRSVARAEPAVLSRESVFERPATRRAVLKYGAAGIASAGLAGTGLSRLSAQERAHAAISADGFLELFINEGFVPMVDGTLVYMRGFGDRRTGINDPDPSLRFDPYVFTSGGQVVQSRTFPLDAEAPEEGCPDPAAELPNRLHDIHHRKWASFFPPRTIVAEAGSTIKLRITNRLTQPHSFVIDGVPGANSGPISPGATVALNFAAPAAGTYIYRDTVNDPVNRVLGLHGVLVASAADKWRFVNGGPEFERQFLWIWHDIEPEWGRLSRMGVTVNPRATPAVPRYFTINDRSGVFSIALSPDEAENKRTKEDTKPCGHARNFDARNLSSQPGQLLRFANTGIAVHQPHFHGNHVLTIAHNGTLLPSTGAPPVNAEGHIEYRLWEDVVEMDPLQRKACILPIKHPPDALAVVVANQDCDWEFPMHCHAEMSQTAGGGLYPGGMVTDWILKP